MCLIVLAWRVHPSVPLIVAANRDEFHARPAAPAQFWKEQPAILGGRDLEAMGTWMGVARSGCFAAVTNYRGAREPRAKESRGHLASRFLVNGAEPAAYVAGVAQRSGDYSGFNLLYADDAELWWYSNRGHGPRRLEPGIYGLGNFLLDSPEVAESKARFAHAIDPAPSMEPLFGVLAAAKIVAPEYGTRCATVLIREADSRMQFAERAFTADGSEAETVRYDLSPRRIS
ncbi:MAG: NRDE family protein [Burkholderiales bacterium]